jgi:uncharacterized membrane protein YdbT with pleckstrin-like domain
MEVDGKVITLRPGAAQLVVEGGKAFLAILAGVILLGLGQRYATSIGMGLILASAGWLMSRLCYLNTVKWTVSDRRLVYQRGVLVRSTDYLELYRVVDYRERQNIIQQLTGLKDVIILSMDRSQPVLVLYGLDKELNIIEYINLRVERCKRERNIYEITNR